MFFYNLELDEQLHDIYQLSKLPCYLLTPPFNLIHHPYPPLEITSLSSEDINLIKMLNLIREGHLSWSYQMSRLQQSTAVLTAVAHLQGPIMRPSNNALTAMN